MMAADPSQNFAQPNSFPSYTPVQASPFSFTGTIAAAGGPHLHSEASFGFPSHRSGFYPTMPQSYDIYGLPQMVPETTGPTYPIQGPHMVSEPVREVLPYGFGNQNQNMQNALLDKQFSFINPVGMPVHYPVHHPPPAPQFASHSPRPLAFGHSSAAPMPQQAPVNNRPTLPPQVKPTPTPTHTPKFDNNLRLRGYPHPSPKATPRAPSIVLSSGAYGTSSIADDIAQVRREFEAKMQSVLGKRPRDAEYDEEYQQKAEAIAAGPLVYPQRRQSLRPEPRPAKRRRSLQVEAHINNSHSSTPANSLQSLPSSASSSQLNFNHLNQAPSNGVNPPDVQNFDFQQFHWSQDLPSVQAAQSLFLTEVYQVKQPQDVTNPVGLDAFSNHLGHLDSTNTFIHPPSAPTEGLTNMSYFNDSSLIHSSDISQFTSPSGHPVLNDDLLGVALGSSTQSVNTSGEQEHKVSKSTKPNRSRNVQQE